jgi:hypothetical protein
LRRRGTRLACEQLEDRTVPSNFLTAANVSDLIYDINYANAHPGSNTIALTAPTTSPYVLTAVNNPTDGGNGLPVIAANDNLTIQGNGDTIARSTALGTDYFRLFDVAPGASLTLANVTLQGGVVYTTGGGIYSSGSLTLEAGTRISSNRVLGGIGFPGGGPAYGGGLYVAGGTVTVSNSILSTNSAQGGQGFPGGPGYGGGLYVAGGTVTLSNSTLSSNSAQGGAAWVPPGHLGAVGGVAEGGGMYVAGGTVSLANVTLSSNSAVGGNSEGAVGGAPAWGGGLFVAGGTVTLRSDTVTGNVATAGTGSKAKYNGNAYGGGVSIDLVAVVYLDAFTVAHTKNNKPGNIDGSYILI